MPHGNSILAIGSFTESEGPPNIPNVSTIPTGPNVTQAIRDEYGPNEPSNVTVNPNLVLQEVLAKQKVKKTVTFERTTKNPGGAVTNIVFEQKRANVLDFETTFWLETLEDDSLQLQYSQTIEMRLIQHNIVFIHIDANTLTFVPTTT